MTSGPSGAMSSPAPGAARRTLPDLAAVAALLALVSWYAASVLDLSRPPEEDMSVAFSQLAVQTADLGTGSLVGRGCRATLGVVPSSQLRKVSWNDSSAPLTSILSL